MTRINVVPVNELCDKHLLAEYRELPRIMRLAREGDDIPVEYTLGTGHVKFFYNKLSFIVERYSQLVKECKRRGFKVQHEYLPVVKPISSSLFGSYTPTPDALAINRERIAQRMSEFKRKVAV